MKEYFIFVYLRLPEIVIPMHHCWEQIWQFIKSTTILDELQQGTRILNRFESRDSLSEMHRPAEIQERNP